MSYSALAIDWGPAASWAAAGGTALAAFIALLVAFRVFDQPRLRMDLKQESPWCRTTDLASGQRAYWVRARVKNEGRGAARGCVGKLVRVKTRGGPQPDIDPLPLRWAGVPREQGFNALTLGRRQHEFLNVFAVMEGGPIKIETVPYPAFDPGCPTELGVGAEHSVKVAVFADNAAPAELTFTIESKGTLKSVSVREGD
jgi:hypothetical protein